MTRDEIRSAAMLGLLDAATRFDPQVGVQFKTFAEKRIRGAVMDEVRKADWFSRSLRAKHSQISEAISLLEIKLERLPTEEEVAAEMGISLDKYREMLSEVSHLGCVSLHDSLEQDDGRGTSFIDMLADDNGASPFDNAAAQQLSAEIASCLARLSEKERLVITLYYYEEMTQKEIAEVLDVTEGRVSQLHSQGLLKLQSKLNKQHRA
jgi:RNA polymerase sigma factor for flagellar operon FliA